MVDTTRIEKKGKVMLLAYPSHPAAHQMKNPSKEIKETQLNLKLRSDLLTAHDDFQKFEAKMRQLYDRRLQNLNRSVKLLCSYPS